MNVQQFMEQLREKVLSTRDGKFRRYFRQMEIAMGLARMRYKQERCAFLRTYYAVMRYLDDIVDGDLPVPLPFHSAEKMIEDALAFTQKCQKGSAPVPNHTIQNLLSHCFQLGTSFGEEFFTETIDLLTSLQFDAKRIAKVRETGHAEFQSAQELQQYFYQCDIGGTIRGCLKAADENIDLAPDFENLGNATRIYYNLRDFVEDVRAGLINISKEDAKRHSISLEDLEEGILNPRIRTWWNEQVASGVDLLDQHREKMNSLSVHGMTQSVLWFAYEKPARQFFQSHQRNQKDAQPQSMLHTLCRSPINNTITTLYAQQLCGKHEEELHIQQEEKTRYRKKATNLALCYRGLSRSKHPGLSLRAAQAGIASCAYDVLTDWRAVDDQSIESLERIIAGNASPEEWAIAKMLFEKDRGNALANDGLERGALALRFIASVMGIRRELEQRGLPIDATGELLQIADDVLDIEEDERDGQLNCLLTHNRNNHLKRFFSSDIHRFFPSTILQQILLRARRKAEALLQINETDTTNDSASGGLIHPV